MATNSATQDKREDPKEREDHKEEEEEEEALSLSDLPVITSIGHKDSAKSRKHVPRFSETEVIEEEDFDFCTLTGLFLEEPKMCAADEVFFQGRILPSHLSFSSESSLLTKGPQTQIINNRKQYNRREPRSESTDHSSLPSEFRSSSSGSSSTTRSSSLRSQNSSSSTSSTRLSTSSKPKIRNQFHTIPSPKPQLRLQSSISYRSHNQGTARKSSSSAWEFFRLGVVPAPEIGLQDLKVRNSANRNPVSRNSSSSSSSNSNSANSNCNGGGGSAAKSKTSNNHFIKQLVGKGGGLLSGCSCSAETVVQLDMMMNKEKSGNNETESETRHAMKEKVKKEVKKVMSRRRTFEWIKELHASSNLDDDEEALLLSNR